MNKMKKVEIKMDDMICWYYLILELMEELGDKPENIIGYRIENNCGGEYGLSLDGFNESIGFKRYFKCLLFEGQPFRLWTHDYVYASAEHPEFGTEYVSYVRRNPSNEKCRHIS